MCIGPGQGSNFCLKKGAIVSLPPFCRSLESYLLILNVSIFAKGNLLLCYIQSSTWGNQRGEFLLSTSDAILAAPLHSCKITRTLIDGGSAINILYRDTLIKLGISESELEPSRTIFHGIVP